MTENELKEKHPYRPRLTIEITEEQFKSIQKLFPHGFQKPFWGKIADEVIDLVERGGTEALALIIAGAIRPSQVLPSIKEIKEKVDGDT